MPEAVVLAGGFGTRLRAVVPDLPKPMAPIGGKPFLELLLHSLSQKGFQRVVLSVGFMAEKISSHFGNHFDNMELDYVIEDQPLGTGGGVRLALSHCHQDHVFVLNGDTFLDFEVEAIEHQWQQNHQPIIVARQVEDTARYGRLVIADGLIKGFSEKGVAGPGLINAGCYIFRPDQLDAFPLHTPFSLEADYLVQAVMNMPIEVFVTTGQFIDIGIPEDYQRAQLGTYE